MSFCSTFHHVLWLINGPGDYVECLPKKYRNDLINAKFCKTDCASTDDFLVYFFSRTNVYIKNKISFLDKFVGYDSRNHCQKQFA